ncbi:hypothetical protein FD754_000225 [Muntiacus muntjak]|uniref:Glycogenin-1 n=1 Tax=Muntiacus muntjak TaxID=9888 RepID=A0A5N3W331_MUNMU|nr:hypothetical protein FD754_000225 [Muntiacus muntjak]
MTSPKGLSYVNVSLSELRQSESHSVMSNSLRPHGLCSPWNSPGQNPGLMTISDSAAAVSLLIMSPAAHSELRIHLLFARFGAKAKVVHFLGRTKPWNYTYDPQTKSIQSESHDPNVTHPEFLSLWWSIFTTSVLPVLQQFGLVKDTCSYVPVLSDLVCALAFSCGFCRKENVSGAVSQLSLGETPAPAQPFVSSEERKERWEQGQADYMGADSFDNIKRKLDSYLQ